MISVLSCLYSTIAMLQNFFSMKLIPYRVKWSIWYLILIHFYVIMNYHLARIKLNYKDIIDVNTFHRDFRFKYLFQYQIINKNFQVMSCKVICISTFMPFCALFCLSDAFHQGILLLCHVWDIGHYAETKGLVSTVLYCESWTHFSSATFLESHLSSGSSLSKNLQM